ncbi:MAG: alpha-amylase family glycosyl hydrolase [Calditrichia bacterium]
MKYFFTFAVLIIFFTNTFAQNGSWWTPSHPLSGDTITISFDPTQNSEIPSTITSLILHWGVNELGSGKWQIPPDSLWPVGSVLYNNEAVRSPMIKISTTLWQIKVPTDTSIHTLHYVFNSGNYWGHNTGGTNWDITLYQSALTPVLLEPQIDDSFGDPRRSPVFAESGDTVHVVGTAVTQNTKIDSLALLLEGSRLAYIYGDTLSYDFIAADYSSGLKDLQLVAWDTTGFSDTTAFYIMVNPAMQEKALPAGNVDGINYTGATSVTLSLFAPYKKFVYVLGDFNDWKVDTRYFMKRDSLKADSVRWWITIDGLTPGQEYAFQYYVDGKIRIADPYTRKVLDPWNDQYISSATYPNLKAYPAGKTSEPVSVLQTDQTPFQWQYTDSYARPAKEDLVVYELLIRDFIANHDYATLIDTLSYLQNLGINAIELMPINEFEGNLSWGYNPSFYFAPDKYYGPANDLKRFVDECHKRGIAVIIDMVLNHSFGQSPLVRLYWDAANNRPSSQNPWYNPLPKHDFNVGYDFNHTSPETKTFVDRVNAFWLKEYKIDGYRFDLTKGFMQTGSFYNYNQQRIDLLTRMADKIRTVDSTAYIIFEHLGANDEETVLSNHGILLWGKMNTEYSQSAMGWLEDSNLSSNLAWGYYKSRGWTEPNLVTYMESHDEQWLMYKNLQWGRASGNYDIKKLNVALDRMKLVEAFFLTLPGPKMMWEFEELGYDQELPDNGRTDSKPILWNYYQQENRRTLYKVVSALLKLRRENEVFRSPESVVSMRVGQGQYDRRINISHPSMNATIIGNFNVVPMNVNPNFQSTGKWYDYFSGDSIDVSDTQAVIALNPGEFRIYTDKKLETPEQGIVSGIDDNSKTMPLSYQLSQNYPNPFNPETKVEFEIPRLQHVQLVVYNILGQQVKVIADKVYQPGHYNLKWDGTNERGQKMASGIYILHFRAGEFVRNRRMVLMK